MANPQPTDAHLRIAHSILEAILLRDFSKRQLNVLLFILRLSWGCKAGSSKKYAIIPRQRDFGIVGIREGHIKAELNWLVSSKVLFTDGTKYWFNKNFDEWQVSRVNPYQPEELTKLVSLNIKDGKKLTELGSDESEELTEKGSENLPKGEESAYQKGKFPTNKLATSKENIKESINKEEGGLLSAKQRELFNILLRCPAIKDSDAYKLPELLADYRNVNHALEFKKFAEWWPGPKNRKNHGLL